MHFVLCVGVGVDRRAATGLEDSLIDIYLDRLASAGGDAPPRPRGWDMYRAQLAGALAMWTTRYCPPKFLPAMQPKATSAEMPRHILIAVDDHEALRVREN
jgi:hypothetical protein